MRLATREDLRAAEAWLAAHGLHTALYRDALATWGDGTMRLTAHLGNRLAHDPTSGEFTVWEEAHFRAAHSEAA